MLSVGVWEYGLWEDHGGADADLWRAITRSEENACHKFARNWRAYQVMGSDGHEGWSGEQLNGRPVSKRLSILAPT